MRGTRLEYCRSLSTRFLRFLPRWRQPRSNGFEEPMRRWIVRPIYATPLRIRRSGGGNRNTTVPIGPVRSRRSRTRACGRSAICMRCSWINSTIFESGSRGKYRHLQVVLDLAGTPLKTPRPEEAMPRHVVTLLRPGACTEMGSPWNRKATWWRTARGHIGCDDRSKDLCELKRDYHPDLWTAADQQLERFYVHDPNAKGFGV